MDKTPIREILTKYDYQIFKEHESNQLKISGFKEPASDVLVYFNSSNIKRIIIIY